MRRGLATVIAVIVSGVMPRSARHGTTSFIKNNIPSGFVFSSASIDPVGADC